MKRRDFLKFTALTSLFAALPASLKAAGSTSRMPRCRVEVVRRECYMDLQSLYLDDPEAGPCPAMKCGDCFEVTAGGTCPDGFCPKAWKSISAVIAGRMACPGGGAADAAAGTAVVSCPDGSRPVIFRIEFLK